MTVNRQLFRATVQRCLPASSYRRVNFSLVEHLWSRIYTRPRPYHSSHSLFEPPEETTAYRLTRENTHKTNIGSSSSTSSRPLKGKRPLKRKGSNQSLNRAALDSPTESRGVKHFRQAVESSLLSRAIALYPGIANELAGQSIISTYLILLGKAVGKGEDEDRRMQILAAANTVRDDSIKNGIPLSSSVFKRLLHIYRDLKSWDNGIKLWDWMVQQDEDIVHLSSFAAAIELFTFKGEPMERIEEVYRHAISERPDSFLEYHLSPNAILDDRNATSQTVLPIDTDLLLEKFLQARLLAKDWKEAYLLLDTAFRVIPVPRPQTFDFLISQAPSLSERYLVARMACRSGVRVHAFRLKTIIQLLMGRDIKAPPTDFYVNRRIEAFNASINLILASYNTQSRQPLDDLSVVSLLKHLSLLIEHAEPSSSSGDFAHKVADLGEQFFEAVRPLLTSSTIEAHNALITIAKRANYPALAARTVNNLFDSGSAGNAATYRIIISVAGNNGDLELVRMTWSTILEAADLEGRVIDDKDWGALVSAVSGVRTREAFDFLTSEAERLKWQAPHNTLAQLENLISTSKTSPSSKLPTFNASAALQTLTKIFTSALNVIAQIKDQKDDSKFSIDHDNLPMSLGPSPVFESQSDLWKIYDEISVDPTMRSDPKYTEIAYEELHHYPVLARRFRDWASVTELMVQADRHMKKEARKKTIVSEETDSLQEPKTDGDADADNEVPRDFEQLRRYVLQVRGVSRHIVQY